MEGAMKSEHHLADARPADPFAIVSLDEASAYLTDRLLGTRYRECIRALSWLADRTVHEGFGERDATQLHASLTLFVEPATTNPSCASCSTSDSANASRRKP